MANEVRLIDYEQAKRATYEEIFWTESEQAVVRNFLAKLPKVDAVPVVRGRWIVDDSGVIICSECGAEHEWQDYRATFCEDCGAKMDGKSNVPRTDGDGYA